MDLLEQDLRELKELLRELAEDYSIRNDYGDSSDEYFVEYYRNEKLNENDIPIIARKLLDKINK
jgi:hypothetical protein